MQRLLSGDGLLRLLAARASGPAATRCLLSLHRGGLGTATVPTPLFQRKHHRATLSSLEGHSAVEPPENQKSEYQGRRLSISRACHLAARPLGLLGAHHFGMPPSWPQNTPMLQSRQLSTASVCRDSATTWVAQAAENSGMAVGAAQHVVGSLHAATGLPWWATIAVLTVGIRASLTTPAFVFQQRTIARYEELLPELRQWRAALEHKHRELARKGNYGAAEATRKLTSDMSAVHSQVLKEHGLWPLWARMQLPLLMQIPVWITLSFALRGLVTIETAPMELVLDFASSGTLWFANLATPDVWYGLPLITAAANLANLEINGLMARPTSSAAGAAAPAPSPHLDPASDDDSGSKPLTISDPIDRKAIRDHVLKGFFRLLSVSMVWIGTQLPAAVCLYWAVSSCYGVAQNLAFRLPAVRRAGGIPKTLSESDTPFADMGQRAGEEWRMFREDLRKNKGR
eukprot:m.35926 g.35926  ORF g.35926 m.35926 type:complete len:458 (+) comp7509_c0_seq1:162-1535(+)